MPITRTRTVSGTPSTGTSYSVTLPSSPDSGQVGILEIAVVSGSSSRVSSITQSGATWNLAVQSYHNLGNIGIETWTCVYGSGAGTSITINMASSLNVTAHYVEYAGVDNTLPTIATGSSIDDSGTGEA